MLHLDCRHLDDCGSPKTVRTSSAPLAVTQVDRQRALSTRTRSDFERGTSEQELHISRSPEARRWEEHLQPLTDVLVQKYLDFLPKQTYPIRTGLHPNTAFGLAFALDYATTVGNTKLKDLLTARSLDYFGADTDYPAKLEPNGSDFLSPALIEADLMRRVLPRDRFAAWFDAYLPRLKRGEPKNLLEIAVVTDRSDPQLGHLDGLNLSRAWCMRHIAVALPDGDPARAFLAAAGYTHAIDALTHVATGHYEGEHWLASFAVYLLTERRSGNRE